MHVSPVAGDGRPPAVDVGGRRGRGTPTASGNKWQPGIAFSRKAQRTWRPRGRPLILCSAALMTGLPLESAKRAARPFLRGSRTAPPHRRRGGWAPLPPALIPFHFASSSLSPPSPVSTCSIAFSSHHHHTTPRLSPPETRPLLDDVLAKPPPSPPLAEGGCVFFFIGAATAKASRSLPPLLRRLGGSAPWPRGLDPSSVQQLRRDTVSALSACCFTGTCSFSVC
jgi:hypothetical protein